MAYFANGTEGLMFRDAFCYQCVHWKNLVDKDGHDQEDTAGCPVYDIHLMHSYELCNAKDGEDEGRRIAKWMLDTLIEDDRSPERTFRHNCTMFHLKTEEAIGSRQSRSVLPGTEAMAPWPTRAKS